MSASHLTAYQTAAKPQDTAQQGFCSTNENGTNIEPQNSQAEFSSDIQSLGIDLDSLNFPIEQLDVDMYGNLVNCIPLWKPTRPQSPLVLHDGTYFNALDHVASINSAVRDNLNNAENPTYARIGVSGLSPQQIHERKKVQARSWQVYCTGELFKKGVNGHFVIGRNCIISVDTNNETGGLDSRWDATWRQSPSSPNGWAFVQADGQIYSTENKNLIDMQAIFEEHLDHFQGDYEAMISAGHGHSQSGTEVRNEFIDPHLLKPTSSSEGSSYSRQ